jgi:glucose-1-phosphate thymidylyltransferase
MVLGDTIFHGKGFGRDLLQEVSITGATATGIHVEDPSEFGVIEMGANSEILSLEEKPAQPKSNYAIPGLYFFDGSASSRARAISPSQRGELEITDLLKSYLSDKSLSATILPRGTTWLDAGSIDGLLGAGELIRTLQKSSGQLIGSPEEAAWRQEWISTDEILSLASELNTTYGRMLERAVEEEKRAK